MFLALKFEPLNQIRRNFQFNQHKEFLKSSRKDYSMQHHFGWKKWQNTPHFLFDFAYTNSQAANKKL